MRKSKLCDQVRFNQACSATVARVEIFGIGTTGIILSIVLKGTSENEFSASIFICLAGGKIFSCKYLDLNLS